MTDRSSRPSRDRPREGGDAGLSPDERERLAVFRTAAGLDDLVTVTATEGEHAAYFAAKREWRDLRGRQLAARPVREGLPGDCVTVDGTQFCVHGITHADTSAEGAFLREHLSDRLAAGASVYCEQGIREMYFRDFPAACAMDDYRWAMEQCRRLDVESHLDPPESGFEGLLEDLDGVAATFQDATFSLIDSGSDVYGDQFASALGDVAAEFLTSHEDLATGDDFASFRLNRRAATDPSKLVELQRYYHRAFLPQPVEREWLRRHDRELEIVTHARNERMADYAVAHAGSADAVHLVVGAAHQPGVTYYLRQFGDGERTIDGFEPV